MLSIHMLPIATALVHASPTGVVGWGVRSVVRILIGSALHWVNAGPLPRFPEEETASPHGRRGVEAILRQFCCAHSHSGSFPQLLCGSCPSGFALRATPGLSQPFSETTA